MAVNTPGRNAESEKGDYRLEARNPHNKAYQPWRGHGHEHGNAPRDTGGSAHRPLGNDTVQEGMDHQECRLLAAQGDHEHDEGPVRVAYPLIPPGTSGCPQGSSPSPKGALRMILSDQKLTIHIAIRAKRKESE